MFLDDSDLNVWSWFAHVDSYLGLLSFHDTIRCSIRVGNLQYIPTELIWSFSHTNINFNQSIPDSSRCCLLRALWTVFKMQSETLDSLPSLLFVARCGKTQGAICFCKGTKNTFWREAIKHSKGGTGSFTAHTSVDKKALCLSIAMWSDVTVRNQIHLDMPQAQDCCVACHEPMFTPETCF